MVLANVSQLCAQAPAERMIRDCVACELAYINTDHPCFIGGNRAIAEVLDRRGGGSSGGGDSDSDRGDGDADEGQASGRSLARGLVQGTGVLCTRVLPAASADSISGVSFECAVPFPNGGWKVVDSSVMSYASSRQWAVDVALGVATSEGGHV